MNIECQASIVTALQEKLTGAIASGDWSATEQWGKNLALASNVLDQLVNHEEIMSLKEKINILTQAIADKEKQIEASKSKETELTEAEETVDKAISDLKLTPNPVTPNPISPQ